MSLQFELHGYDRSIAEAVLRELDGEHTPAPAEASSSEVSAAEVSAAAAPSAQHGPADGGESATTEPTLAQSLVEQYEEDDDFDPDEIDGETLVSLWWDNDSGMPNWCGGVDLVLLADESAVMIHKGDSEGGVEPVNLPTDDAARANAIASWLAEDYHSAFAALDLEPLDPSGTLSEGAKTEWHGAMSKSNSRTHVSVGAIESIVRDALGNDTVYARVRDAIADPTSDEGQLVLTAIRATGDAATSCIWSPASGRTLLCEHRRLPARRLHTARRRCA